MPAVVNPSGVSMQALRRAPDAGLAAGHVARAGETGLGRVDRERHVLRRRRTASRSTRVRRRGISGRPRRRIPTSAPLHARSAVSAVAPSRWQSARQARSPSESPISEWRGEAGRTALTWSASKATTSNSEVGDDLGDVAVTGATVDELHYQLGEVDRADATVRQPLGDPRRTGLVPEHREHRRAVENHVHSRLASARRSRTSSSTGDPSPVSKPSTRARARRSAACGAITRSSPSTTRAVTVPVASSCIA